MVCPLRGHTSPITDATVCMRLAPNAVIDMVLSVPSPSHSPGLTGRRNPKYLLRGRSAKVFAVLGGRNHLIDHYRDLNRDFSADRAQSTIHDRGSGLELRATQRMKRSAAARTHEQRMSRP